MKAAVLHSKEDLRYEEIETPLIEKNEVLIEVKVSGICGSDIPRVLGTKAHFYPIVLGHEFSGIITKIGEDVKNLKIGDKVACAPLIPCHRCKDCKAGNFSLCKNYSFIGSRRQGSFAEYIAVPEENVFKLSDEISFEQGAFFEPSTVALHGLKRLDFKKNKKVAIIGDGTIALILLQWAKIFGSEEIAFFGDSKERLDLAIQLGVDKIGLITDSENLNDHFDYVYDVIGKSNSISKSLDLVSNRGQICIIGTSNYDLEIPNNTFQKLQRKEALITGSWMSYSLPFPGEEWNLTARYFSSGDLKIPEEMIFKRFSLKDAKEGFELFNKGRRVYGKVLLINDKKSKVNNLKKMVLERESGANSGVYSICSSNRFVIEAAIELSKKTGEKILLEATPNQVNQYGGYSGMTPKDFVEYVKNICKENNFDFEKIILGADHLGPFVWRNESEETAMRKAKNLAKKFAEEGFTKIHIDTTMKLGNEESLSLDKIILRSIELIEEVERNSISKNIIYVLGSEVPLPGGDVDNSKLHVTSKHDFIETVKKFKERLSEKNLPDIWQKIIAVVIQPGVEFYKDSIKEYNRNDAKNLMSSLSAFKGIVFEGHSTDYQKKEKLREMVEDGIAILKVGPALTFALTRALFDLERTEKDLQKKDASNFFEILISEMKKNPKYWKDYYDEENLEYSVRNSLLDRSRYYLDNPAVKKSVIKLLENLKEMNPEKMIKERIINVLNDYQFAVNNNNE